MENCLIIDIGGADCRFMLFQVNIKDSKEHEELFVRNYEFKNYKSIEPVFDSFLDYKVCKDSRPKYCFIVNSEKVTKNSFESSPEVNWGLIDGFSIAQKYHFNYCKLFNTMEAFGNSYFHSSLEDFELAIGDKRTDTESNSVTLLLIAFGVKSPNNLVRNLTKKEKFSVIHEEVAASDSVSTDEESSQVRDYLKEKKWLKED